MNILDSLKGWYSMEEAAARLSRTLGQMISERDVIQLAAEGHLVVSWYLKGEHKACPVGVSCALPRGDSTYLNVVPETDETGNSWLTTINGPFVLPVDLYPPWGWWLLTFIGKGWESAMLWDPIIIDPDDGRYWAFFTGSGGHDFAGFPAKDEIIVSRKDIEAFERRHNVAQARPLSTGEASEKEREKLLKHVAGLAMLLSEKHNRYKSGTKANGSTIAEDVAGIITNLPDASPHGAGMSSIRASIAEGIKLIAK